MEAGCPLEIIRFGPYEVRLRTQELYKRGRRLRLPPQAFQVLRILLEQPGQLVTREDLFEALWPANTFVDFDHGLNCAIKRIRDVLDDSADAPLYIETLPRLGYRFIGQIADTGNGNGTPPVVVAEPPLVPPLSLESKPLEGPARFPWASIWVGAIVLTGLAVSGWWYFSRKTHALTERDTVVRTPERPAITIVPFTTYPGFEFCPAFSPDGESHSCGIETLRWAIRITTCM